MPRPGIVLGAILPVVLSAIPGWGHIWVRRYTRGLALFLAFFAVSDTAFLTYQTAAGEDARATARVVGLGLGAAIWAFSLVDIVRIAVWLRSKTVRDRRAALFRKTVIHFLRGEHAQAEESIRRMLRIDPYDVPALTYLGMVRRDAGRHDDALRTFRKAARCGPDEGWSAEIEHEIDVVRMETSG